MTNKIKNLFSLEGRVAIVTGGDGRLGIEHAKALSVAGATVYSFDTVRSDALAKVATHIDVDITEPEQIARAVSQVIKDSGRIDILVNNAVIDPPLPKEGEAGWEAYPEFPQAQWEKEISVGLSGAQYSLQAVAPIMIKQKKGSVIQISSTSGITAPNHSKYPAGRFKSAAYPTVKTGLLGLTRAWASYFSAVGAPDVRVNALCLGAVNFKEITPELLEKLKGRNMLGRPASPDEYHGALVFLASDASAFMTAQTLIMDGGQTTW
ncbi:MAG: SDR family oxidoreductase [bacterium]|nr:SDR family oxidoreductase [bacterium]